jgi:hypothetical protein
VVDAAIAPLRAHPVTDFEARLCRGASRRDRSSSKTPVHRVTRSRESARGRQSLTSPAVVGTGAETALSARSDGCESRRRFRRAAAIGGLLATPIFYWIVTAGRLDPFHAEPFGNLYDVQARSLLHGRWSVPTNQVTFEGFRVHGKTYIYFGPVPSIFRMPIEAITHSLDGRLTQVSMLAAFAVALVFVARLSWRIRCLIRGTAPVSALELWAVGAYVFLIATGSVILFLGSRAIVYHEDEIWAIALALGAYDAILEFLAEPSRRAVVLAATWGGLAFLTRGSVGAGPVLVLGSILTAILLRRVASASRVDADGVTARALHLPARLLAVPEAAGRPALLAPLAGAVAIPVALYVYVNETRFGRLLTIPYNEQIYTQLSAFRRHVLAANGGSLLGLKFVPTQLLQLLRPDALRFQSLFPWVTFPRATTVVGHATFDTLDWSSSISSSMPLLAVLGLVGIGVLVSRRRRHGAGDPVNAVRAPLLGAVVGGLITMMIAYVANRYLSDFLPAIVLASLVGLHWLLARAARRPRRGWTQPAGLALLVLAAAASLWINFGLAITYQRLLFPAQSAERVGFIGFQQHVDRWLPGAPRGTVRRGRDLPAQRDLAELFVVGRCGGLYWSDSRQWFAIERANAAGHFRLSVHFPAAPFAPEALVSIGSKTNKNRLIVRGLTPTRAQFLVENGGVTALVSKPVAVRPGQLNLVDVVLDYRVRAARVSINGHPVLDAPTTLVPGDETTVGAAVQTGGPARFSAAIQSQPISTPLCDSLLRRYAK